MPFLISSTSASLRRFWMPSNSARLQDLLGLITEAKPDVVVAELGASPLEPYNSDTALELIQSTVAMTVLCSSTPYAVLGVMSAYHMMRPDLVAGVATSASTGVEVVEKLSGAKALDILDRAAAPSCVSSWRMPSLERREVSIGHRTFAVSGGPCWPPEARPTLQ